MSDTDATNLFQVSLSATRTYDGTEHFGSTVAFMNPSESDRFNRALTAFYWAWNAEFRHDQATSSPAEREAK